MQTVDDLPAQAFSAVTAADAGIGARELRRLRETGAIDRIGRGLYRRADLPPANLDLVEIAARSPSATVTHAPSRVRKPSNAEALTGSSSATLSMPIVRNACPAARSIFWIVTKSLTVANRCMSSY